MYNCACMYRMKTKDEMKELNIGRQLIFSAAGTDGGQQTVLFTVLSKCRSSFVLPTWWIGCILLDKTIKLLYKNTLDLIFLGIPLFLIVTFISIKSKYRHILWRGFRSLQSRTGQLTVPTGPHSDRGKTKPCLLVTYTIRSVHLSVLYESGILQG